MPKLTPGEMGRALDHADAVDPADAPTERGPWRYAEDVTQTNREQRHFLESADFTHDVRLHISGDFANDEQRRQYGKMIAERLNAAATRPAPSAL